MNILKKMIELMKVKLDLNLILILFEFYGEISVFVHLRRARRTRGAPAEGELQAGGRA